jgi:hypothetical protein
MITDSLKQAQGFCVEHIRLWFAAAGLKPLDMVLTGD